MQLRGVDSWRGKQKLDDLDKKTILQAFMTWHDQSLVKKNPWHIQWPKKQVTKRKKYHAYKIPDFAVHVMGSLHNSVIWYKIAYAGEQVVHWDFQNNATRTSPPGPAFVLESCTMWPDRAKRPLLKKVIPITIIHPSPRQNSMVHPFDLWIPWP